MSNTSPRPDLMKPLTPKNCFMCDKPITDPADIAAVPKAFTHGSCAKNDPKRYALLELMSPCCEARATVEVLRGCLVQNRIDIPDNEVWLWDPEAKNEAGEKVGKVLRYGFTLEGRIEEMPAPPETTNTIPPEDVEPPPPQKL